MYAAPEYQRKKPVPVLKAVCPHFINQFVSSVIDPAYKSEVDSLFAVIVPAAISFAVIVLAAIFDAVIVPAAIFAPVIVEAAICVAVIVPAAISAATIAPAAIFHATIAPAIIFPDDMELSNIFVSVIAPAAIKLSVIADTAIFEVSTAPFAIFTAVINGSVHVPPNIFNTTFPEVSVFGYHVASNNPPDATAVNESVVV